MCLTIIGVVGIFKKKPLLLRCLTAAVLLNLFWVVCWFILLHTIAEGYVIAKEATWFFSFLFIVLLLLLGLYFFYTLESLCFTLQREREEEEEVNHSQDSHCSA